jgi:hypothetical protein
MPASLAKTARGRYMELIFEAGIKAVDKKSVQDEVSASTQEAQDADVYKDWLVPCSADGDD